MPGTLARCLVCTLLLLAVSAPLTAQSLGELARREAERRKTLKDDGRVLTNKDVPLVPQPEATTTSGGAVVSSPAGAATPPATAAESGAASEAAKDETGVAKDQRYWSERQKALQLELERDQIFAEALQSRVNALTRDFVNRDDPAQRAVIAADRQKALDEITRVKAAIAAGQQAVADLEEEARRAGVPPGWLR